MRALARLILAGLVVGLALAGYTAYRVWDQGNRDERQAADAIIVMGAAQYDGRPSPLFRARLDHAIELFHEGLAPWLVVTGGKAEGDRTTEADAARLYAIANDVPEFGDPRRGPEPHDAPIDPARRRAHGGARSRDSRLRL